MFEVSFATDRIGAFSVGKGSELLAFRNMYFLLIVLCLLSPGIALSETTVSGRGDFYTLPLRVSQLEGIVSIAPNSGQNLLATVDPQERIQRELLSETLVNDTWDAVASLESGDNVRGIALWRRSGTFRIIENVSRNSGGKFNNQPVPATVVNGYQTFFSGRFFPGNDRQFLFISPGSGDNRFVRLDSKGNVEFDSFINPTIVNNYQIVTAGDFDGDKRTDLFFWNPGPGENRLVLSRGSNPEQKQFQIRSIPSSFVNGNDFTEVIAADVDGNGKDELFFYHTGTGRQRVVGKLDTNSPELQSDPFAAALFRGQDTVLAGNFLSQAGDELALIGNQGQLRIESLQQSALTGVKGISLIPGSAPVSGGGLLENLPQDPKERGDRLIAAVEQLVNQNGGTLRIPPVDFVLTRPIDLPSNTLLSGAPGTTIFLDALHFDNQDRFNVDNITTGKPVGFRIHGKTNVTIEGLTIRLFHSQGGSTDRRFVRAITARRSSNIVIRGNDIASFTNANGIISVDSSRGVSISDNTIHDSFTDHINEGNFVQITGINIDEQRINGASSGITIERNTIRNLLVSDRVVRQRGFETDGITISSNATRGVSIRFNDIQNVGEGIDNFGSDGEIHCNEIIEPRLFGIKLIHGAQGNRVHDNLISTAGNSAVVLAESATVPGCVDTKDNRVFHNEIRGVRRGTFGIRFDENTDGTCSQPVGNDIRNNAFIAFESGATLIEPARFVNTIVDNLEDPGDFSRRCPNTRDAVDHCPNDPNKTTPGVCGCQNPEIDSNSDGIVDCGVSDDPDNESDTSVPSTPENDAEVLVILADSSDIVNEIDLESATSHESVGRLLEYINVVSRSSQVRSSRRRRSVVNRLLKRTNRLNRLINKSGSGRKITKRRRRMLVKVRKLIRKAQRMFAQ